MSSTKLIGPEIVAQTHRMANVGPSAYRLTVDWRIANPAETQLYVLIATPIVTVAGDPLILDHTNRLSETVNPNLPVRFRFVQVAASAARVETLTYGIGLERGARINVVGCFGFGYVAPDPTWEEQRNWHQVKLWQCLVESARFIVTGP